MDNMQKNNAIELECDVSRVVISSRYHVYKTERFIKQTRRFSSIDTFINAISDGIIFNFSKNKEFFNSASAPDCFEVAAYGCDVLMRFKLGAQTAADGVKDSDIVFYEIDGVRDIRRNDMRLTEFLRANPTFNIRINKDKTLINDSDFSKIYRLSNSDGVNFPLLNDQQRSIVETEDKNVLVQGVAGSGKTNICIDRIVYSACRNYSGRILYSTFSRGLLLDTKSKLNAFIDNLESYVAAYDDGRIVFTDSEHKQAVEERLGIYFDVDGDDKICAKIKELIVFLKNKVDYYIIEDLYHKFISTDTAFADENYFTTEYLTQINNHQLAVRLDKLKSLSFEVVYKEIYGLILGSCDPSMPQKSLSKEEYISARRDSFTAQECDTIYALACDYSAYLSKKSMADNNSASREMIAQSAKLPKYSLAVIDEVQDMTQVNLCLIKKLARKLFCVGDALQMINPSFFSFAYLKRLLYEKDVTSVAELAHNYRNSRRIAQIVESLGLLNVKQFGTHSFVLKSKSMDENSTSLAVYVEKGNLLDTIAQTRFDNMTVVVSGSKQKDKLRKRLKSQEILTVSEIKGLERDSIILYNVLSDNSDKWRTLERINVNRKQADENSVFRYYFNLFYVGVSRAKTNVYVVEDASIAQFKEFFLSQFEVLSAKDAEARIKESSSGTLVDTDELIDRVEEFLKLGQYDNARFAADKIDDDIVRTEYLNRVEIYEKYISSGDYRGAGIRYWEIGLPREAKQQFVLSGDEELVAFVDATQQADGGSLSVNILDYIESFKDSDAAMKLIIDTVKKDFMRLSATQKHIADGLKNLKEKKR